MKLEGMNGDQAVRLQEQLSRCAFESMRQTEEEYAAKYYGYDDGDGAYDPESRAITTRRLCALMFASAVQDMIMEARLALWQEHCWATATLKCETAFRGTNVGRDDVSQISQLWLIDDVSGGQGRDFQGMRVNGLLMLKLEALYNHARENARLITKHLAEVKQLSEAAERDKEGHAVDLAGTAVFAFLGKGRLMPWLPLDEHGKPFYDTSEQYPPGPVSIGVLIATPAWSTLSPNDTFPVMFGPPKAIYEGHTLEDLDCFQVAAQRFMDEKVSVKEPLTLSRAERRRRQKAHEGPKEVSLIRLRRPETHTRDADDDRSWDGYSCHFLVGSHWRKPNARMKVARPVFVSPYLKGDPDKPFKLPSKTIVRVDR